MTAPVDAADRTTPASVRAAWVAALVVALLVVLLFHLALYPWPNFQFGGP